jgi:DNA (cytosine-5)-methyltransferase 1
MGSTSLGPEWRCRFANDFDAKKCATYRNNWNGSVLVEDDVRNVGAQDLPGVADLAWASFPCQDLSIAGTGAGLSGERSGTFWPFWKLMRALVREGRGPRMIAIENVSGLLSSHGGSDFAAICSALQKAGYAAGAVVIDAVQFVPQSRQRLFIIGVRGDIRIPSELDGRRPSKEWHPPALRKAVAKTPAAVRENWIWWRLPSPEPRTTVFADLIEDDPSDVTWHSMAETRRLIEMMSDAHRSKLNAARRSGGRVVGTLYKRTRTENGCKVQRAEIRFDDVAGCLRTPSGGSSRQTIVVIEGRSVRSRLLSGRETARLMGLPEDYWLPANYTDAYHLTGDGVVVPVVEHLAAHLFEPLLAAISPRIRAAA